MSLDLVQLGISFDAAHRLIAVHQPDLTLSRPETVYLRIGSRISRTNALSDRHAPPGPSEAQFQGDRSGPQFHERQIFHMSCACPSATCVGKTRDYSMRNLANTIKNYHGLIHPCYAESPPSSSYC